MTDQPIQFRGFDDGIRTEHRIEPKTTRDTEAARAIIQEQYRVVQLFIDPVTGELR